MKLALLLLSAAACALPVLGSAVTYDMTFTGGLGGGSTFRPFAPQSGSFTYDPATGFSNFLVDFDGDVFNFTSAANAPRVCASLGNCTTGDAADEFHLLTTYHMWSDIESSFSAPFTSTLTIGDFHGGVTTTAPGFIGFSPTAPPAVGSFTLTAAPEPGSLPAMALAGAAFLCAGARRRARSNALRG